MFGILAQTFQTATRVNRYDATPCEDTPKRSWKAPRHWVRKESQQTASKLK